MRSVANNKLSVKFEMSFADKSKRVGGYDSMIIQVQDEDLTIHKDGSIVADNNILYPKLVHHSQFAAVRLRERLHHADWTLTNDITTLWELAMMHDCEVCRSGAARADRYMRATGTAVVVGQLYWLHPEDYQ